MQSTRSVTAASLIVTGRSAAYSPSASLRSALDDRERGQRDPKIARSEDEPIRRWSRPSSIGPSADEWCRRSRGRATPYQTRSMLPSREGWTRGSTGDAGPPRRALSCLNAAHFRDDRSTKSPLASHDVFHCAATVAPSAAVGYWSGPHNVRAVSDTADFESDASSTQFAGNKAPPLVEERPVDDNSVELALRGWLASFAHDRALARSIALIAARLTLSERS